MMQAALVAVLALLLGFLPLSGLAVIVRLPVSGDGEAQGHHSAHPPKTALIMGAAELLVPETSAGNGLSLFLRSLERAYAAPLQPSETLPVLVLVLDDMTARYATPILREARHYRYIIYRHAALVEQLPAANRGPGWTVHSQRYLYYDMVLSDIAGGHAALKEAVWEASTSFCDAGAVNYEQLVAAGACLPQPSGAFMTDLRDVVLQGDVFGPLWALVKQAEGAAGTRGQAQTQLPNILVVAQEWEPLPLGMSLFNVRWLEGCFSSNAALSSSAPSLSPGLRWLETQPILCSGTTLGTLPAVRAYLGAMASAMPACAGAAALRYGWDQAVHQGLVRLATAGEGAEVVAPPLQPLVQALQEHGFLGASPSSALPPVSVVVAPAEGRWLCTLSFLSDTLAADLWEPAGGGFITGLGIPSAAGINVRAVATGEAPAARATRLRAYTAGPDDGPPTAGGRCLVVHQYDRYPVLKDAMNVLYGAPRLD